MTSVNDITGDKLVNKPVTDTYRDNYDKIFNKQTVGVQQPQVKNNTRAGKKLTIHNWKVIKYSDFDYGLVGNVCWHINFHNGAYIYTSPIVDVDKENGIVETYTGSLYHLIHGDLSTLPDIKENNEQVSD